MNLSDMKSAINLHVLNYIIYNIVIKPFDYKIQKYNL